MPRRGNVPKREILPDPMYGSVLVTRLVNNVMLDGKKGVAQKVVYAAFDQIKEKTGKDPVEVFTQAMDNIMPSLEVKARHHAGPSVADHLFPRPERTHHGGASCRRDHGRRREQRSGCEKARGHAQAGRGQQGVRALPLVS